MSDVGVIGLVFIWHKVQENPIKELHTLERGHAHEQEETIENRKWYRDNFKQSTSQYGQAEENGNTQVSDTLLPGNKEDESIRIQTKM